MSAVNPCPALTSTKQYPWDEAVTGEKVGDVERAAEQGHSWNIYCGLSCKNVNTESEGG